MSLARRRLLCLAFALCGLLALPGARFAAAQAGAAPLHLQLAEKLVANISPQDTSYGHGRGMVLMPGYEGATKYECHTDCSGLLNHLLRFAYGVSDADLKAWVGSKRPTARYWHDAIAAQNRFQRIERVSDLRPGDVVAIKYPVGSENTGHVMLVAATPQRSADSAPLVAGTEQWIVTIVDETSSSHGKGDTRLTADGKSRSGVGRGMFRIYTDGRGAVMGYTWSTSRRSEFRSQNDRHLEIGRLTVPSSGGR